MDRQIKGQMSIFDFIPGNKIRKPCQYTFDRYIGQKVWLLGEIKIIAKIESYYTFTTDRMVGTPSTIYPVYYGEDGVRRYHE